MTAILKWTSVRNGVAVARRDVPELDGATFRVSIREAVEDGARVAALFGHIPEGEAGVDLYAVLAFREQGQLRVARTRVAGDSFPSLTPECPQVHLFEREIAEQFGLRPEGHPWLKPVRFVKSIRPGHDAWGLSLIHI